MKGKKKTEQVNSIKLIKLINTKYSQQPQKTIVSTKQKTFATIEQNQESHQGKHSLPRYSLKNRLTDQSTNCFQRMQTNNISPFSDDDQSLSPKLKKINKSKSPKQKRKNIQQKLVKKKSKNQKNAKVTDAKKNIKSVEQIQKKPLRQKLNIKKLNDDKGTIAFQNQLLIMMNNNNKITEVSQEDMDGSLRRRKKNRLNISGLYIFTQSITKRFSKNEITKNIRLKLKKKYQLQHPQLDQNQLKFLVAIVTIQTLWRQKKVKQVISQYVTPKSSPETSFRQSINSSQRNQFNLLRINNLIQKKQNKSGQLKKQLCQVNSATLFAKKKFEESLQEVVKFQNQTNHVQQNSILSVENQNQKIINQSTDKNTLLKFVECYRQAKLGSKKKSKAKTNVFNLKQSLSEKCLMQKYYGKLFLDKAETTKTTNFDTFSHFQQQKWVHNQHKQQQIFKIQQQQKILQRLQVEIIEANHLDEEVWVRSQTHQGISDNNSDELELPIINRQQNIIICQKRSIQQICSSSSIRQISQVSEMVIGFLMQQFSVQWKQFTQKKCLTKKKKSKMPCFQIDDKLIQVYLDGLINKILQNDKTYLRRSLNIFQPLLYLKSNRAIGSIYDVFQYSCDQEENYFWQIMSIQSYMEYQGQYEAKYLKFTEQQSKYINFNQLAAKIVNRCIYESFQNQLNAYILDLCPAVWETTSKTNCLQDLKKQIDQDQIHKNKQSTIMKVIENVKVKVLKDTKKRLFSLHNRSNQLQQIKYSKALREEFDEVGQDSIKRDKIYQLNSQLSEMILISLLNQLEQDLQAIGSEETNFN